LEEVGLIHAVLPSPEFWEGRRVLLTGHTGFKGSWTSLWLEQLGARVTGFALAPDQDPALYDLLAPFAGSESVIGDLADHAALAQVVDRVQPEVVLHLAAQPLVRRSYRQPRETFATNVQGTVNLLDAAQRSSALQAVLVVTTDKVYAADPGRAFREDDRLGGSDPYSASKACAELVAASYRDSFFADRGVPVATARAGNVLGGGDWSEDRLVPDVWRAVRAGRAPELRQPASTRPWQHVLEPIGGYLSYVEALVVRPESVPPALNFGPLPGTPQTTAAEIAEAVAAGLGGDRVWVPATADQPAETPMLALDATWATETLGWQPRLDQQATVAWTAEWYRDHAAGGDPRALTLAQLRRYQDLR
jgi:CDP-glucose 4,6-dehydratase